MAKNLRKDRDWREPIRKSEVATDFGISLARVQWDFFATPTFAGKVPRTQIAHGLAFRWLQDTAKVCRVPYNRLLIALRGEVGEEKGRFHFHCLGGTATRNYHSLTHWLEHLWKVSTCGARVEIRQYDRSLAGADYVCKCLGANAYELNKYSFANTVTLSASVNHPSGESTPSEADIKVTRDLIRAGQLLKLELIDHVVIGNGNFSSLRALGYFYA